MPGQVEVRASLLAQDPAKQVAAQIASLATGHNRLVHDLEEVTEKRTAELLKVIDQGDKELRDVLRYLLRGSVVQRIGGVAAILVGIALSLAAAIVGA